MNVLKVTDKEFEYLKSLQERRRWDWPAVFSTNCRGEIWPFTTYGWTKPSAREHVRGLSAVIDQVADTLISLRSGGRFFIDDSGAFCKPDSVAIYRFLVFEIISSHAA